MILRALLALWTSGARPMGDHLWQSTLFLAVAAILALALRKNQARVRYWVWLTASLKFLIPFALLIALGSHLAKPRVSTTSQAAVYSAVENISQPFAAQATPMISEASPAPVSRFHLLPPILIAAWLAGIAVVLLVWATGWIRVSRMVRRAVPLERGPEVAALRSLESSLGVRKPMKLVLSRNWMEPGIFGIFRPVLIWPEGLSQHLDDRHIDAIVAHEICHARRHDNLTAMLHMLVEAVFWFHPLVWWMGTRLEEERERACDEEVSLLCNRPHVYAESILRVCKFCSESPLACVSGITGADLKKRIMQIMTERVARKLDLGRKLLLTAAAAAVVAAPLALGLAHRPLVFGQILHADEPVPSFELASIRANHSGSGWSRTGAGVLDSPGVPKDRFIATNAPIRDLMKWAWAPGASRPLDQVSGGPSWIDSDRYDIDAKLEDSQIAALEKLTLPDRSARIKLMVQSLLADRFRLVVKYTTATESGYALVVAKGGPKLQETALGSKPPQGYFPVPPPPPPPPPPGGAPMTPQGPDSPPRTTILSIPGDITAFAAPVSALARSLQGALGSPVLDQTGLKGNYNFHLRWTPDVNSPGAMSGPSPGTEAALPTAPGPSIFTAVQEQLGLKLEPTKGPVEGVVIEHIEKPSVDGAEVSSPRPSASAPVLIHSVEPEFTEKARQAHASGVVLVNLWVDQEGNPRQVRTLRGLGMGLDQKAIEAVKQYRFTPAMSDGKPMPAQLTVAVKFQIF